MQPGSVSETVTVTEQLPLVETTNDTLGGTFANKSINDLPLNGRDFQNLVVLRPGVQRTTGGGFLSISSNGNRTEDKHFIVDGTDNNDPYYATTVINAEGVQGTPGSILPIDAIQEFNAQENPPAEYGWKPGAIVNLGLKSGTNDVHGTAYLFERNNAFDARNYFNPVIDPNTGLPSPKKAVRQHQFGGSIGGPIVKNKTFIFGAYEGLRALVGNSEQLSSPATVTAGGDPTISIPDAMASVVAHGLPVNPLSAKLVPLFPTNTNTTGALNVSLTNKNRNDNFIIKADHHINERHSLSGRYFMGDSLQTELDIPVLRPQWESQSQLRAQVVGVNYTWVPSTAWVNEARFGYNRFWQSILTADHASNPATVYGINTGVTNPADFGMPEIAISGFNSLGGNHGWPLLTTPNSTYQFVDNISYAQGKFSTTAALGIKQVGKGIDAPYHGDHNNFSPRLGLSWDPWGRGKTVIRAGGGVTYEIPHLAVFLGQNGVNNASTAGINVIPTAASTGIPGANGTIAASAVNVSGTSLNWSLA